MILAQYICAGCFAVLGMACVVVTPLGLPGTWIMIGVAGATDAVVMWLWPALHMPFGVSALVIAVLAGTAGEIVEFLAGALGAKAGGASRKGAVGSMIGSIVGLIIGTVLIPIPLAGSAIGAIAGAIVGAIAGEKMHGREMKNSLKPAAGAAIGRILGALSKAPFALVAWSVLMWDAFT